MAGDDDILLKNISKEFSNQDLVSNLAVQLLMKVGKGGYAFLESHCVPGTYASSPASLAFKVLRKWVEEKPTEATRGALFEILAGVSSAVADNVRSELIG